MHPGGPSRRHRLTMGSSILALMATSPILVNAQSENCIPLKGSSTCPAFQSASFSKDKSLTDAYSFLSYVSDTKSFDEQLSSYIKTTYIRDKYQDLFGCDNIDLTDSKDWYARFTTTVICNAIVQKSAETCGLSEEQSIPLCADACADFAQSAAFLTSNKDLCANPSNNLADLIRADFTTCHLPEESLSGGKCITGADNEPENCGFGSSLLGFCWYCSEGGVNSTDTCCYNGDAEGRCEGVQLPSITATLSLETPSASSNPTESSSPADDDDNGGLSGGAIAGIVVGSLAAVALIAAAVFFCLRRRNKGEGSQKGSIFNQPSPSRKGPGSMIQTRQEAPQGYEVLPGGRIARMSALEGHAGDSSSQHRGKSASAGTAGAAAGAAAGYMAGHRKGSNAHSSSDFGDSPLSEPRAGVLRPPPSAMRRNGSLSSNSVFGTSVPQSPTSAEGGFSSPQGVGSQQSEQLPFFKDYYSQDDIHPGDRVAALWAYQPRATDEFTLERGDMLKIVGIWDDGWATGIMLDERADEWEMRRQTQRDSGVSNASGRRDSSPPGSGEIKAFPLVCVCMPEHWRKTIDGDGSTEAGSNGNHGFSTQT